MGVETTACGTRGVYQGESRAVHTLYMLLPSPLSSAAVKTVVFVSLFSLGCNGATYSFEKYRLSVLLVLSSCCGSSLQCDWCPREMN